MLKKLLIVLFAVGTARAQQQTPVAVPQPDCVIFFKLTASGNSGQLNNRQLGCSNWAVIYTSSGFTAETVTFEDAPDASGVPGAWVTFAGTTVTGANPMTSIVSAKSTFTGYYPWLMVNVSGLTGAGTISGAFFGWRDSAQQISGGGGAVPNPIKVIGPDANGVASTTAPVQVAGNDGTNVRRIKVDTAGNMDTVGPDANAAVSTTNPVQIAGNDGTNVRLLRLDTAGLVPVGISAAMADGTGNVATLLTTPTGTNGSAYPGVFPFKFNGTAWDRDFACTNQAAITFTAASGSVQIVALTASQIIRVCHLSLSSDTVTDITLQYGTGSACGTGTTAISGAFKNVTSMVLPFGPVDAPRTAASNAFCISSSNAATIGGLVTYSKY